MASDEQAIRIMRNIGFTDGTLLTPGRGDLAEEADFNRRLSDAPLATAQMLAQTVLQLQEVINLSLPFVPATEPELKRRMMAALQIRPNG